MATISMYENKQILRDSLMKQIKAYRNISIKSGLLLWIFVMCGHYSYNAYNANPLGFLVAETLYKSFIFSAAFGVIGYCFGSIVGTHLQRHKLVAITEERVRRRQMLEQQIALRQSKLEQFAIAQV